MIVACGGKTGDDADRKRASRDPGDNTCRDSTEPDQPPVSFFLSFLFLFFSFPFFSFLFDLSFIFLTCEKIKDDREGVIHDREEEARDAVLVDAVRGGSRGEPGGFAMGFSFSWMDLFLLSNHM
jgi:hypothetical protein